ncbi:MAG TPA: efflux RND transporter periplasmic adaptor subunit [Myxococcales bacterium]|nr:efflux RND transporter periplasmic adaptor subunit [Myxococcales bacterium]
MPARPVKARSRRVWLLAIGAVVLAVVVLAGIKALQIGAMINAGKSFTIPPETVTSAKVDQQQWRASRAAVATLTAVRAVTVSSELPGLVRDIGFENGSFVRRGDVLVKLDVSTEEAQLAAAEADVVLAKQTLARQQTLRERGSSTPAEFDAAQARANQTTASAAVLRATIAKKTIRAPFDGRIAIRQVELGQVLSPGAPIASLQTVTPVYADFWLPQQVLADLRTGMQTRLVTDVFPQRSWDGLVTVVNPEVDPATRNVRVRATFPNTDGALRPGMFANVEVLSPDERPTLVIPATAVLYAPFGDSVFAIETKDKQLLAKQKFVRLGERRGDLVAVTSGLEAGETIVSSGAFKLHNGSALVLRNDLAPTVEAAPNPKDDK